MDLREFLEKLEASGKLIRVKKEVSTEFEIANVMNSFGEQPIIFENVKDSDYPVFGGITSSRDIIAEGMGTTKEELLLKLVGALRDPIEPAMVDKANAPCQEVVTHDPDLSKVPFLMHLEGDGGKYATATCSVIKDPDTGRNMSYHRLMYHGGNKFTARLIPKRQTRTMYDKVDGEVEMAVCIGNSVPVMIAASLGPAPGTDELAIANALGKTDLVKCITKDLEVPASSEIVLEGRLIKQTDREGPFVDLTETRDFERQEPIFIVDCITHRKDAMYQALLAGRNEHKLLMGMPKEPTVYDEVSKVCECKNAVITLGGGSWLHGIVQIVKKNEDDGRKAILAAFLGHKSMKHVMVVEEDVDIFDPISIEWALATRFQAHKDAVIMPDQPGSSLDPSGDHSGKKTMITKVGLDVTKPAGVDPAKYVKVSYKDVNTDEYRG
ncbi:MAG: UbiD family decarboxylase [Thermoplasmata archaeon]|nr:UbiD family decarboxylase [Thermoplasmata archaeon]